MARKTYIHVNQHLIKANAGVDADQRQAPLTVKDYTQNRKAFEAIIHDRDGREVARVVYRPDNPLDCGAKVWIETTNTVTVQTEATPSDVEAIAALLEPVGTL